MRGASFLGVPGAAGAAGVGEPGAPGAPGAGGASTAAVGGASVGFGFVVVAAVARGFEPVVIAATHELASSYAGCRRAGRYASPGSRPA